MHDRLDVLFKSADDAVKEPWESPERRLGCLVMWLNINSLLTTNVRHSLLFFFFLIFYLVWLALCLCSSGFLCSALSFSDAHVLPPPPPLYQKHSSHIFFLAPGWAGLVRLCIWYSCQSPHYYSLILMFPFCMSSNPYPEAFSCSKGMKEEAILGQHAEDRLWPGLFFREWGFWRGNMMSRCLL